MLCKFENMGHILVVNKLIIYIGYAWTCLILVVIYSWVRFLSPYFLYSMVNFFILRSSVDAHSFI